MLPQSRIEYRVAMLEKSLQLLIEEHHSLIVNLTKWLGPTDGVIPHHSRAFLHVVLAEKMRKLRNNPYFPDDNPSETPSMFGPGKPK